MNVDGKSLKKFITYNNNCYDILGKFKKLERENKNAKTLPFTAAKSVLALVMCGHESINEFIKVNQENSLKFNYLYKKKEYIPSTHGLRDCIIDTDYKQIEDINKSVIKKLKNNKFFTKNKVDGLSVMAWDGVELNETVKDIKGLPEREHSSGIKKYMKYTCGMNVGPIANIMITSQQHLEVEKITTKSGKERAKTIGETKAFESMWKKTEKEIGTVIDVHVFDALYLDRNVTNLINENGKYFVIRLKDESREIYKDAKGLFEQRKADHEYETVEHVIVKEIHYSKKAKKKDTIKKKTKIIKRDITDEALDSKKIISEKIVEKKNSTVKIIEYEIVKAKKEVWDDEFELAGYNGIVRVLRSKETSIKNGKEVIQELFVVTNMLNHDVETILKIMHLRWNIENCGFRTIKQRYNIEHIFIGELNAINYIVQMIILAFNLFELYTKLRLKNGLDVTWDVITKIFERDLHSDKSLVLLFNNSS